MANLILHQNDDGLEFHIDTETSRVYASIRATARMVGRSDTAIRSWASANQIEFLEAEILTPAGLRSANLLTSESVFRAALKYCPELAEKMGTAGANVFMLGLAGYKVQVRVSVEVRVVGHYLGVEEGGQLGEGATIGCNDGTSSTRVPPAHTPIHDVCSPLPLQQHESLVPCPPTSHPMVLELPHEINYEGGYGSVGCEEAVSDKVVRIVQHSLPESLPVAAPRPCQGVREGPVDEASHWGSLRGGETNTDGALLAKTGGKLCGDKYRYRYRYMIEWVEVSVRGRLLFRFFKVKLHCNA